MISLGIDIGTTSICLVCFDVQTGKIINKYSQPNRFLEEDAYTQDPKEILQKIEKMLDEVRSEKLPVSSVGITSQMHGIVFVNAQAEAVSPLYTWKNEFGNERFRDRMTYAEYLSEETGYPVFSGFGSVTHFYLQKNKRIPEDAVSFVSIGDYLGMQLTGGKRPKVHRTMAAGFGIYNFANQEFDRKKLQMAGVDTSFYPQIAVEGEIVGNFRLTDQEIPVYFALGDNQAGFLGAVEDRQHMININVGTGSQVSAYFRDYVRSQDVDIRPYPTDGYLYVGASLNGGKAYEKLADFFAEIGRAFTDNEVDPYGVMDTMGRYKEQTTLQTVPNFYGQRGKTGNEAGIYHISIDNFHPADLIRSFAAGMAQELFELYESFPEEVKKGKEVITASGNGLRKNKLLLEEVEKKFQMRVLFSDREEEAAAGAAMYAATLNEKSNPYISCPFTPPRAIDYDKNP